METNIEIRDVLDEVDEVVISCGGKVIAHMERLTSRQICFSLHDEKTQARLIIGTNNGALYVVRR